MRSDFWKNTVKNKNKPPKKIGTPFSFAKTLLNPIDLEIILKKIKVQIWKSDNATQI